MLSVVILSVVMLSVVMLSVIMLSVIMLSVVILCRYVECRYAECCNAECRYVECCYAECCYAECRYVECRSAINNTGVCPLSWSVVPTGTVFFLFTKLSHNFLFGNSVLLSKIIQLVLRNFKFLNSFKNE
jgi:hypothetical protein